jgi:hypothetical protein
VGGVVMIMVLERELNTCTVEKNGHDEALEVRIETKEMRMKNENEKRNE